MAWRRTRPCVSRDGIGRSPGTWFARVTFVLSSLVILAVCLVTLVLPHWNLVAYLVLLPFLPRLMRPYC